MKILLLPSLYIPNIGGIETFTRDIALSLIKRGHSVTILTKKWPDGLKEEDNIDGITIYRIFSAKNDKQYEDMYKWLRFNLDKLKADIIHVIGIRRCLPLAGIYLSRELKIPVIMTIAGSEVPQIGDPISNSIWNENKKIIEYSCKNANAVTSFSIGLRDNFSRVIKNINVDVLYAGIDLSIFTNSKPYKHNKDYILSARRLSYDKGVDILIKAFSKIKLIYDIDLIIAGDGPELDNLKKMVKKYKLSRNVFFVGSVDLFKISELLSGALMTVVPSRCEGGGLINIEAQASGCPVIATDVGGIREYIKDGFSGLIIKPENYYELYNSIQSLLLNTKKRNDLVKNGIIFSKNFDFNLVVEDYIKYYHLTINSFKMN